MGAKITIEGKTAVIKGVRKLYGANVKATDLRGGAALVMAAMSAKGVTKIENIEYILRGYEKFEEKLLKIGADIKLEFPKGGIKLARKAKETDLNLYYLNSEQNNRETIDDMMNRKKVKEREKRIKANKQKNQTDNFDLETDTVINMTNRNKIQKEQEKRRRLTKEEQKRRKRNKKIKRILKFILLLAIVIGGTVFAMTSQFLIYKKYKL